ncbi:MAG: DUF2182 domain-containing protein [Sphingobium sp.]|nr:DUF2182 domain-containing protein [Sphingobium sp.]
MSSEPAADPQPPLVARIASRQSLVVGVAIFALCALAWWWLWRMAAPAAQPMDGMAGMDMSSMPGMDMPMAAAPITPWSFAYLASTLLMWSIMMVAMMLPSAAPMILIHEVVSRKNRLSGKATLAFGLSYLALWVGFSALAALAQAMLVSTGVVAEASLAIGQERLTGLLLLAAGLFELSPLKQACLTWCQSPVGFLTRYWRPGLSGAIGMGLRHGAFCIGCCWLLMLLLFVGGVMNLAWVALLSLIVLAEKYLPAAWRVDRFLGALLILGGCVALLR